MSKTLHKGQINLLAYELQKKTVYVVSHIQDQKKKICMGKGLCPV